MRLDRALVERGWARSRGQAVELIRAGRVSVDGLVVGKASFEVADDARLAADQDHYVSRAAHKLAAALDESATMVPPRVLDAGASTGGFTQVCLERGADQVYAVDVGHGQLAPVIRQHPRVVVWEGVNLRRLTLEQVGGQPVGLIVADVSFISLTYLVAPLAGVLAPGGIALLLVKPQFEVGRDRLGPGGLVIDPADQRAAVEKVAAAGAAVGWRADWRAPSRLPGEHGNQEFFLRCRSAP
ncbi:MAG: TlyA family RNA methyltransferase [Propionibacteriaceae bacterium]|nr:TlyA family RNA methyltransferase [Propionibacteriaceae bacterium]